MFSILLVSKLLAINLSGSTTGVYSSWDKAHAVKFFRWRITFCWWGCETQARLLQCVCHSTEMRNYPSALHMTMEVAHSGSYNFDSAIPSLSLCYWCQSCISYLKNCRNYQLSSKSSSAHKERCIIGKFLAQDKLAEGSCHLCLAP